MRLSKALASITESLPDPLPSLMPLMRSCTIQVNREEVEMKGVLSILPERCQKEQRVIGTVTHDPYAAKIPSQLLERIECVGENLR